MIGFNDMYPPLFRICDYAYAFSLQVALFADFMTFKNIVHNKYTHSVENESFMQNNRFITYNISVNDRYKLCTIKAIVLASISRCLP